MNTAAQNFDVNIAQAGELGNQFVQELCKLREIEPVHWSAASGCWLVTGHQEIVNALEGKYPLSLKRLIGIAFHGQPEAELREKFPTIMQYMPNWIIDVDPPVHTRLRKLLVKAFSKKVVDGVRPFALARIDTLIQKMKDNPTIEFNEEIARALPGTVILKLLGISQEHYPRLKYWANTFVQGIGVPYATEESVKAVDVAMADMNTMLTEEIEKHRANPQDDLLSAMLAATEDGESLTMDEMLGALHVLIVAGHDTTSNTMTLGTAALARNPAYWDYMYRNPDQIMPASLELMRYIAMSTSQPRVAAEDFEWNGQHIKRGDLLFLFFAAGNRDPRAFPDPEKMDPLRNNEQSLVFAPGIHHCIGHLLAKMQVSEFFSALVNNFSGAELLDERMNFMPQIAFRGLFEMNVRMIPR